MIKQLEDLSYEEGLRLFRLEKKRFKRDPTSVYKYLMGAGSRGAEDRLFAVLLSERTRCNGHKMLRQQSLFRKSFFLL